MKREWPEIKQPPLLSLGRNDGQHLKGARHVLC